MAGKTQDKPTEELALYIKTDPRDQFSAGCKCQVWDATVVVVASEPGHPDHGFHYGAPDGLRDLTTCAQQDTGDGQESYGWDTRFSDVYTVTLPLAQAMVKTLSHIEKSLAQQAVIYGYPTDWASYLLRVAVALGITRFVWKATARYQEMTGYPVRWGSAQDVTSYIRHDMAEFKAQAAVAA